MTKERAVTSQQLFNQSEALRKQAEELKKKEIPDVVARMKEAIAHYGLTAADLGLGPSTAGKVEKRKQRQGAKKQRVQKSVSAATKPAKVVKYRDEAGNTWSGRGPSPKWFKEALANGASRESLLA